MKKYERIRGKLTGTEDIYKIYAESFKGMEHLRKIQDEAQAIVAAVFKAAGYDSNPIGISKLLGFVF